jgi:hypothetical protein
MLYSVMRLPFTPLRHSFAYSSDLEKTLYCSFQRSIAVTNVATKVNNQSKLNMER